MALLVISYSRVDRPLIEPIVDILKDAFTDVDGAVFWDRDLKAGRSWFEQIRASIDGSRKLYVFWCLHSAASDQVQQEYEYALDAGKTVVPVLVDSTPLAPKLAGIHGVDLRKMRLHDVPARVGEIHLEASDTQSLPAKSWMRSHHPRAWTAVAAVMSVALILGLLQLTRSIAPQTAVPTATVSPAQDRRPIGGAQVLVLHRSTLESPEGIERSQRFIRENLYSSFDGRAIVTYGPTESSRRNAERVAESIMQPSLRLEDVSLHPRSQSASVDEQSVGIILVTTPRPHEDVMAAGANRLGVVLSILLLLLIAAVFLGQRSFIAWRRQREIVRAFEPYIR